VCAETVKTIAWQTPQTAQGSVRQSGRYAVWTRCDRDGCGVRRYDVVTRSTTVIPVDTDASGASVSRSGTVYLVHGPACSSSLVRVPRGETPEELGAPGRDLTIGSTYAASSKEGTIVYLDESRCSKPSDADIYAYVDRAG
jgi:hypothetical protein